MKEPVAGTFWGPRSEAGSTEWLEVCQGACRGGRGRPRSALGPQPRHHQKNALVLDTPACSGAPDPWSHPWFLQQDWGGPFKFSPTLACGDTRPPAKPASPLCSLQEILEEVVRELHKVKEEIIDGEWQVCPGALPRVPGEQQGSLSPRDVRQQSWGVAQPESASWARGLLFHAHSPIPLLTPTSPHSPVQQTEAQ